jgi:ABC-2 type transport system permease protein
MTTVTYREATRPAPAPAAGLIPDTWYLTGRRLRALGRQPFVLGMGVSQPVIWLFLFGELFHKVIDIPGFGYQGSYLAYLIPGIVAMNAMSGNMWAGMSTIEEIDRGTLNRFLVTIRILGQGRRRSQIGGSPACPAYTCGCSSGNGHGGPGP